MIGRAFARNFAEKTDLSGEPLEAAANCPDIPVKRFDSMAKRSERPVTFAKGLATLTEALAERSKVLAKCSKALAECSKALAMCSKVVAPFAEAIAGRDDACAMTDNRIMPRLRARRGLF